MLSRTIRKSVLDTKLSTSTLPPTFLLPFRARCFNSTTQNIDSPPETTDATLGSSAAPYIPTSDDSAISKVNSPPTSIPTAPSVPTSRPALSDSVKELLPLLRAQPAHFVTAHIHAQPYLVTEGDIVRLPFHMPGVVPGDMLRLNRATSIGSRDYTLKGTPYLDERIFECRARVMGTEAEPMRTKEKKKRRTRKTKTVKSKHKFTILRIAELKVLPLEEIET
ncbi:hypothetical protein BP5796_11748 [Coleophoma crateriformis]|uniref:Large ribosomal subunit protein bL21m n=1 Tax=Coleophoma crateriformis TaxID=565419 RepID=A0A3D8QE67_9HELO|nr:hypothetical protein BP5796_11748 [Coleophoma crateriformis]